LIDLGVLSWWAIVVAAFSGMALGALWYSPVLFGNAWLAELGTDKEGLSSPQQAMIGSVVSCLISAVCVAIVIQAFGAVSVMGGIAVGALCGVGFVATAMLSDSLFSGWGWKLYFIQTGYRVVYLVLMGAIIGAWPA
jgi:hypothetical protein